MRKSPARQKQIMGNWTRRAFLATGLVAGGGLVVGIAIRPGNQIGDLRHLVKDEGGQLIHSYVKIDTDNIITAIVPHAEMGQGAQTALAQMLAEELDAEWDKIRIEEAPAVGEYAHFGIGRGYLFKDLDFPDIVVPSIDGAMMKLSDSLNLQITGGSMSLRITGSLVMRVAGAATRQMLCQAAAKAWHVPLHEITTEGSYLLHTASSQKEAYSVFAENVSQMTPSFTPKFKQHDEYKIIGKFVPRQDIPPKVDGSAKFALDIRRPNMLYATIIRSPVFGGNIVKVNDRATRAIDGVVDVIELSSSQTDHMVGAFQAGEAVAVVADSYWSAKQGIDVLDVEWSDIDYASGSSEEIFAQFRRDISNAEERESDLLQGNTYAEFLRASKILEAD
ncbi:MAG: molybdopterin-dependent oxidoreductase, partial [Halieaceae bacterium]|nr:molybdopterin-dependent oxidoreductase [Halieaceae bacterium]